MRLIVGIILWVVATVGAVAISTRESVEPPPTISTTTISPTTSTDVPGGSLVERPTIPDATTPTTLTVVTIPEISTTIPAVPATGSSAPITIPTIPTITLPRLG